MVWSTTRQGSWLWGRHGRGCGQGGGRASAKIKHRTVGRRKDLSHGWQIGGGNGARWVLEHEFTEEVIGEMAPIFFASAIQKITVERAVRNLNDSITGYLILFTDEVLQTCHAFLIELNILNLHKGSTCFNCKTLSVRSYHA